MIRSLAACLLGAAAVPAAAAVLLTGYGVAESQAAARAAARDDLAVRLQRAVAAKGAAARSALVEGRELPLIGVETSSAAGGSGRPHVEARLTDASLATYGREAAEIAQRLRKLDSARVSTDETRLAEAFAQLDQLRRVSAVLRLFSSNPAPEAGLDEAALERLAAKNLSPAAGSKDLARRVKAVLERDRISGVRIVAPVRAENSEVTGLSGRIADDLRRELGPLAAGRAAGHSLDGAYRAIGGKILLKLYLLDGSFSTERGFAFVLPGEREGRAPSSANGFTRTLSRGLVRVDMAAAGASGTGGAEMGVDVQTERGRRGLYYHFGDRDRLLVKLDRPGYYYVVGHVDKAGTRLSYLMEIGEAASGSRFVRRVGAEETNQWQAVGEFTVEPPFGLEAVQVFATSEDPERALPPARFDSARKLYVIGTDPGEAVKRSRGLVLVEMGGEAGRKGVGAAAVGEAVLHFVTLQ